MDRMDAMDRIDAKRTISGPQDRLSNSSPHSGERMAAVIALIQRTRSLSSLPLSADAELRIQAETWLDALSSVPDALLVPSWRKATADHDWSRPFPVMAIAAAAKLLILEDNERRETERRRNIYQGGTYACRYCDDCGYVLLEIYCRVFKDWRRGRAACECESAPITQRRPTVLTERWRRDPDTSAWCPPTVAESPRCTCLFCKNDRN
jgi:hypothetical protein